MGGFAYLTFSQNLEASYNYVHWFNAVYWVCSALTILTAIQVILTSMLVSLLGPGLALNGPVGSMARASEGMKIEQQTIITSFFMMMGFFALSTVLLFWVVMDSKSAVASTIGFFILAYHWCYYCSRIYRRFYFDKAAMANQAGRWGRDSETSSPDEPMVPVHLEEVARNPLRDTMTMDLESGGGGSEEVERPSIGRPSFVERMSAALPNSVRMSMTSRPPEGQQTNRTSLLSRQTFGTNPPAPVTISRNPKDIAAEGFVVMNTTPQTSVKLPKVWERRYLVMNYRGQLSYYKTRQDYRGNPAATLNPRPLSLDDFFVSTEKTESDASTVISAEGVIRFQFSLVPRDDPQYRTWIYRTDTEEELEMWVSTIRSVAPSCFRSMV